MQHRTAKLYDAVRREMISPFVCTYPPRSAYKEAERPKDIEKIWLDDRRISGCDVNLYVHVPFCAYKCGFCNLYTVRSDGSLHDSYVEAVCRQLASVRNILFGRRIRTLYIGGGTPTMLSIQNLSKILGAVDQASPTWRSDAEEIAIEASPDSLVGDGDPSYTAELRQIGFNRVNLGVQSLSQLELKEAGRARAGAKCVYSAISAVKKAGFPNLSTDLIIGFLGQTDASWIASVRALVDLEPETISTYFLAIRPDAGFGRGTRYSTQSRHDLFRRYDIAREWILEAGYVQDSNVRFKIPGRGGYKQKELQFSGVPVLGIGAGARSYNSVWDYVIGGGTNPNPEQIRHYVETCGTSLPLPRAGFKFDEEERTRKRLVLGLNGMARSELLRMEADGFAYLYEEPVQAAFELGLIEERDSVIFFTKRGFRHLDSLAWSFFSETVKARYDSFYSALDAENRRT